MYTNIIPNIQSIFKWNNKVKSSKEYILIGKYVKKILKIIKSVKSQHSYDCPCIIFFNIDSGNNAFFKMDLRQFLNFYKFLFLIWFLFILVVSIYPGNLIGLVLKGDPTTYPGGDKLSHFISIFFRCIGIFVF